MSGKILLQLTFYLRSLRSLGQTNQVVADSRQTEALGLNKSPNCFKEIVFYWRTNGRRRLKQTSPL